MIDERDMGNAAPVAVNHRSTSGSVRGAGLPDLRLPGDALLSRRPDFPNVTGFPGFVMESLFVGRLSVESRRGLVEWMELPDHSQRRISESCRTGGAFRPGQQARFRQGLEDQLSKFVDNPIQFAADCAQQNGRCAVVRENIIFLDDGSDLAAIEKLNLKCGHVVITPDANARGQALLYHTSCSRMNDVVSQIFQDCLEGPVSFPQPASEMTVGVLQRRCVALSYDDCRAKVEGFSFQGASQ